MFTKITCMCLILNKLSSSSSSSSYTSILNQNNGAAILVKMVKSQIKKYFTLKMSSCLTVPRLLRFICRLEVSYKTGPPYKVFYFDRFICIYQTFYMYVWLPYFTLMKRNSRKFGKRTPEKSYDNYLLFTGLIVIFLIIMSTFTLIKVFLNYFKINAIFIY